MELKQHYDIAIVGYGPTGVTLANLLVKQGLSVLVLEREPQILQLPRAIRFDAECMRVFQTIGIAEKLQKELVPGPGMKFVDAEGNLLITWERPTQKGIHQWSSAYRIHQPDLEATLREHVERHPLLTLKLRHEVYKIDEQPEQCTLFFENLANGTLHQATAKFVVGCDGARSLIRRLIGTTFEDLNLHSRWLVVDFIVKNNSNDLGDYSIQFCDPQRPMSYIKGTGQRLRWEIMVMPEDDVQKLTQTETIWQLLSAYIQPENAEIERAAVYTFHALLAKQWYKDRLIIAGDAAHQTPPFMGQGMAAGIRDAANLAWKLKQMVSDDQHSDLIESYHSERISHVKEFIEGAVSFGKIIQNYCGDHEYQQQVSQLKNFITPTPKLGKGFIQQTEEINGQIAPQFILAQQQLSDDVAGYHFCLFVLPEFQSEIEELELHELEHFTIIYANCPEIVQWLRENHTHAILIRPDRYIFGKASSQQSIEQLIKATHLYDMITH
ncbi:MULTISPECIES: bifunctional 3-(3-hydroxy-phenyl)propionate/3-hydroxycinnamic acid hydroxylase [unclassified Acinetobacter]|uniref:bifunctional 3-(3-hydroxy-phenyl)propionate/3-hydroxycinnamic acid hydroxylase MhpA n=1 Tax=unclassified Acinetobacter TaxID=196816 RepID=UPI00190B94BF|nr:MULTISPECIES: bifunctional 3-(3-hydroxy-phenyl)propionate/3-hydroxycinnamic acid hydroxylase [unclassified Acinetobacter]MBK0062446.1 bifunctional 3-(3-hydroxy-phenyl)propionate/3-hydroxycinnamic acid hydroxylase [Acinetobacter sp. S55]MBK0066250.1 bifunctional 3-(3-hydroxy-phenyl)propionate/3-hydroxycinnamic acid hydroxylase [Acinetobacter sp. S54]